MIRPALHDAPHSQQFCKELVSKETSIVVACKANYNQAENDCFHIVNQYVEANGGERIIGWAIWERPGVFIEAELHAVWRDQKGECIDIVPRPFPFETITFLPDPKRNYAGRQVDNVRKPLIKDNDLVRYLFLFKRRFEIMNTGDLAHQHGEIQLPKKLHREYMNLIKESQILQKRLDKKYPDNV